METCHDFQFRFWGLEMNFSVPLLFFPLKFICPWVVSDTPYLETAWNSVCFSSNTPLLLLGLGISLPLVCASLYFFLLQLNVVNSVSISEDIKPLPGLPGIGNMNYPSASPGSLVKHICAICGDRSSGTCRSQCPSSVPHALRVPREGGCSAALLATSCPVKEKVPLGCPAWGPPLSLGAQSAFLVNLKYDFIFLGHFCKALPGLTVLCVHLT